MNVETFIQHALNSLTLGSLYALIAIGYTMVYGILRLINFAHSEIFMLGAYFVFWGVTLLRFCPGPWPSPCPSCSRPGWASWWTRWPTGPCATRPRISALISSIGVSFFLQNVAIVFFQAIPRAVYRPEWMEEPIIVGNVRMSAHHTCSCRCCRCFLMLALVYIVYRTKTGLGMRAISKDIETSYLMGVPVNRVIAITFGIGSALAAASGIMWALRYPQLQPIMGTIPGFKAFIAAVFGGIGSIQGAVVGGVGLGFIEIMTVAFFPDLAGYRDAFAFVLLIAIVLLVKPTGSVR